MNNKGKAKQGSHDSRASAESDALSGQDERVRRWGDVVSNGKAGMANSRDCARQSSLFLNEPPEMQG